MLICRGLQANQNSPYHYDVHMRYLAPAHRAPCAPSSEEMIVAEPPEPCVTAVQLSHRCAFGLHAVTKKDSRAAHLGPNVLPSSVRKKRHILVCQLGSNDSRSV